MSEDGWNPNETVEDLLAAYVRIEKEIANNHVQKEVKESKTENCHSRHKKRIAIHSEADDAVFYLPEDSDEDDECKAVYFKPPLQIQRNQFVKSTLKDYILNQKYKLSKLAVLGCGESSIEKYLCHDLGNMGIERVISVDIEESSLAKGIRLLRQGLNYHNNLVLNNDRLPVLYEHYLGDILKYDERLVNTDCVCSTEVIEHIPLEDAETFVRLVLDQIKPKLFILSTPNHEYNKAFGMDIGQFRHDDHKYEFNREQFAQWIDNILMTSGLEFRCEIHYVGNLPGYEDLQGATQFATFYRCGKVEEKPFSMEKTYLKVILCLFFKNLFWAAETVACNGLHTILLQKGRVAFREYLQNNILDESTLIETEYSKYWEIPLEKIIDLMELPPIVLSKLVRDKFLEMLKATTKGRIFMKHGVGQNRSNVEHFVIVPSDCSIENLIKILHC